MRSLVLVAGMATLALGASPQLFLSPPPRPLQPTTATPTTAGDITLTGPQANAVIAHHLGVSGYENLPTGDGAWRALLGPSGNGRGSWRDGEARRIVVLVECGSDCDDVVPESMVQDQQQQRFLLPSLPMRSWTSLVTLHLHRLAVSLGIDPNDVWGLQDLVKGIKSIEGWMGWVGAELGNAIGWERIKKEFKTPVIPGRTHELLTDLDFTDDSAATLVVEMESLSNLVDSLSSSRTSDSGPQTGSAAQVVAIHIKGFKEVAAKHSRTSSSYQRAASLLRQTLAATIAAFESAAEARSEPPPKVALLALPPYQQPLLIRRAPWLKPFDVASHAKYMRSSAALLRKRQFDDGDEGDSDPDNGDGSEDGGDDDTTEPTPSRTATPQPVVPVSRTCFASEEDAIDQTASCLGHGTVVKGISLRGADCWVCSCQSTVEEDGRKIYWAGEGCEKQDLSGDFNLLFFSGAGLVILTLVSVVLLKKVGDVELPSVLASVSGAGHGGKRD